MVSSCCAVGCTNRHAKGPGISFHTFPSGENRKVLWVRALTRKNWKPSPNSVICGKHFQTGKPNRDEGHPDFVPNVFKFSQGKIKSAEKYEIRQKHYEWILSVRQTYYKVTKEDDEVASSLHSQNIDPGNAEQQNIIYHSASENTVLNLMDENDKLKEEIACLKSQKIILDAALEMDCLKEEIKFLQDKLHLADFSTFVLKHDKQLTCYTGVAHLNAFQWILSTTVKFIDSSFTVPEKSTTFDSTH